MGTRSTLEALSHIAAIRSYIEGRNPTAAARVVERIFTAAARLGDFPHMGHTGIVPGTREWTVSGLPYVIVHELLPETDEVIILGVFHGARDRGAGERSD
jgi:toxin ParE1/3/4